MRIRKASTPADRLAVMEVWHAATERDEPLAYHQALRLALLRRHLGSWWLLEEDGRVLSSLMSYPLRFTQGKEVLPAYGLGAVSTRPEARLRGRAEALCRHACEAAEAEGRGIGLLFSALAPAYYGRLGFVAAPAWRHVCTDPASLAASGEQAELTPLDPRQDIETLLACYGRSHAGLHVLRDEVEWHAGLTRNASDVFFGVGTPLGGYVRLNPEDEKTMEVVELMVSPEDRAPVLRAVAGVAAELGREIVEGWFDPVAELDASFEDRGRPATLPMVRGTTDLDGARFWGSDYF